MDDEPREHRGTVLLGEVHDDDWQVDTRTGRDDDGDGVGGERVVELGEHVGGRGEHRTEQRLGVGMVDQKTPASRSAGWTSTETTVPSRTTTRAPWA
jgi:hypothetical protein